MIVRRLIRMCMHCSKGRSRPAVVMCSATIANPREHAVNLTGLDPKVLLTAEKPVSG